MLQRNIWLSQRERHLYLNLSILTETVVYRHKKVFSRLCSNYNKFNSRCIWPIHNTFTCIIYVLIKIKLSFEFWNAFLNYYISLLAFEPKNNKKRTVALVRVMVMITKILTMKFLWSLTWFKYRSFSFWNKKEKPSWIVLLSFKLFFFSFKMEALRLYYFININDLLNN